MKATGRYAEGAANRQILLDIINAHPGITQVELSRMVENMSSQVISTRLLKMATSEEIRREKTVFDGMITYRCFALVANTLHYEKPKPKGKAPKWVTRNDDPNRAVTPNPDAMHSGSKRVYVSSCAEFV